MLHLLVRFVTGCGAARTGDHVDAAKNPHQLGLMRLDHLDRPRAGLADLRTADTRYAKLAVDSSASKTRKGLVSTARRELTVANAEVTPSAEWPTPIER